MSRHEWIAVLWLFTAAWLPGQDAEPITDSNAAPGAAAAGNNAFAFDLYARLRAEDGNLFFAPMSVRTALAMTWAGARGRTAEQMAAVLHVGGGGEAAHTALADLLRSVRVDDAEGGCVLTTANSLWGQRGEPFLPAFLELCSARYGAGFGQLDFVGACEEARRTINAWVGEETRDRIPELLKEGMVDTGTVLVLTNAIDFDGSWAEPFDRERTTDRPFWIPAPEDEEAPVSVDVPTMQMHGSFGYHEDERLQAIELPYAGEALSMVVLLPRDRDGLDALEAGLDRTFVDACTAALQPRPVAVYLPRFSARTALRLNECLVALGMTDAFRAGAADFSGMNGRRDLFIGLVAHEAVVDVDEEGTEASGATAVLMKRGGSRPVAFRADHPFVFMIRDRRSGAVVFCGRIVDPSAG